MPLCESELSLPGMFLAYMHTGSYLLICETQSPAHDLWHGALVVLKKRCFFRRAFLSVLGQGTLLPHTHAPTCPPSPLSAFNGRNPV